MYECGFCGKKYEDENDYVSCVMRCNQKVKEVEEKKREQERQNRIEEINESFLKLESLIDKFNEDYSCEGYSITLTGKHTPMVDNLFGSIF